MALEQNTVLKDPEAFADLLLESAGGNHVEAKISLGLAIQRYRPVPLSFWIEVASALQATKVAA
jgi:hypothetical protein